jgi:L-threonylcarbamoyladenylate synthase
METKKLSPEADGLSTACEILQNGGVVAIPTETVYGLAANAYDERLSPKYLKPRADRRTTRL